MAFRRSRAVWIVGIFAAVLLLVGYRQGSLSLPAAFSRSGGERESVLGDIKVPRHDAQEIHGLLHLVAQSAGQLPMDGSVDGAAAVPLGVYAAAAGRGTNWDDHVDFLLDAAPVVIFSKTYCPYSKRGKALIESYQLQPPPVIVELDTRPDGQLVQQIVARLTGRRTVPNVLVKGKTIGGSDDLHALHNADQLRGVFESAGLRVNGNV